MGPSSSPGATTSSSHRTVDPYHDSGLLSYASAVADSDSHYMSKGSNDSNLSQRPSACSHCRSLKRKCSIPPGQSICLRCQRSHLECVAYVHENTRTAPIPEDLQQRVHEHDLEIDALIEEIDKTKANERVEKWLAQARSQGSDVGMNTGIRDRSVSASNPPSDFDIDRLLGTVPRWPHLSNLTEEIHGNSLPGHDGRAVGYDHLETPPQSPDVLAHSEAENLLSAPEIVTSGLIAPGEVHRLFDLYFNLVNPFFPILDPELHTPAHTIRRCHFLFTVICALASRFCSDRPNLHRPAMQFARNAAGKALTRGPKSIDICQAYILLAMFSVPKKKLMDDGLWLFMGVAFKLATELKLSSPSTSEVDEREDLNRTRTWMLCFNADATYATQYGKTPVLSADLVRASQDWYRSSELNLHTDMHVIAHMELNRVMSLFRKETCTEPEDWKKNALEIAERYDIEISDLSTKWERRFCSRRCPPICSYRTSLYRLVNAYSRLIVLCVGFQKAVKEGVTKHDRIVHQCFSAAQEVVEIATEQLFPVGVQQFTLDVYYIYISFAASFLLNLLTPRLSVLLQNGQAKTIKTLVQVLVEVLESRAVALDGQRTPYKYAEFLQGYLHRHFTAPEQPAARRTADVDDSPRADLPWLDVETRGVGERGADAENHLHQRLEGLEVEFSLSHFLETLSSQSEFMDSPSGEDAYSSLTAVSPVLDDALLSTFQWPATEAGHV